MNQDKKRILNPYEKNQLRKFGVPESAALNTEKPVEYLTNHVEFCELDFYVDESVLIPRIESEELVALAVQTTLKIHEKLKRKLVIADVGTGCGALAICISRKLSKLGIPYEILATDISAPAVEIAKKNAAKLAPDAAIEFEANDLLMGITKKFDLIIANLPYIPSQRIPYLDKSVKDFEPHIALDGGDNGLQLIYKMIKQAEKLVYPHSKILLEVDYTHGYDEFNQFRTNWSIVVTPDSSEGVHFVELTKK